MSKFVVSVLALATLGLLQVEASYLPYWNDEATLHQMARGPIEPPNCAAVLCFEPNCPNPVTPKGQCCSVCPKELEFCPIEGQIYHDCGTACPPTCVNPYPRFCTKQCVLGCQCPQGTFLDEMANKCVKSLKECKPQLEFCPIEGQIYHDCGTACPPTCANPYPRFCTKQCVLGCQCPQGTFLDEMANKCVKYLKQCMFTAATILEKQLKYCPIEGQIYHDCGTACPPTCADPYPGFCTKQCVLGCQCPQGTFLDEMANKCVKSLKGCTCPPDCTHDFCSSNPRALCNVGWHVDPPSPGPRELPGCFRGQCQLTFCPACYYSKQTRDLPGGCQDCGSPVTSLGCLRNWATCIHDADMQQNGRPDPSIMFQEYFKCYRYPCMLRG